MPHILIEHSANVPQHHDIGDLVDVVHAAAIAHGLAPRDALRTRAAARRHYRIADGQADHAFIAIQVRIGPGRDPAAKTSFIEQILDRAQQHLTTTASPLAIAWSIELIEIDPAYRINRNGVRDRLTAQQPASQREADR